VESALSLDGIRGWSAGFIYASSFVGRRRPRGFGRTHKSQPSSQGPAECFTGSVLVDPLFPATPPSRTSGAYVTFEPGARTAWHTHPYGQHLVVTAGSGQVQQWGGPIQEIHPGDVVWIPPGTKHWHGAAETASLTHIAVQEQLDGRSASWMEKVSDGQYKGK